MKPITPVRPGALDRGPLAGQVAAQLDRVVEREPRRTRRGPWSPALARSPIAAALGVADLPAESEVGAP